MDARYRGCLRQGAGAIRQADRQLPGCQAPVCSDVVPCRAGRCGRRRCGPRRSRFRWHPTFDRRGGGREHRHRRRQSQRQGLYPGARWYRLHLGARRAFVSAPGPRNRWVPRWIRALAASGYGADPGRCPSSLGRRPGRGGRPATGDRGGGRRGGRVARGETSGGAGGHRPAGAALAGAVRARRVPGRATADRSGTGRGQG